LRKTLNGLKKLWQNSGDTSRQTMLLGALNDIHSYVLNLA
jgi:hypothetical protein